MRRFTSAVFLGLLLTWATHAEEKNASPLRLIPNQADVVVQVKQPRQFIQSITEQQFVKDLSAYPTVMELLQSTQAKRFFQFVSYYESELGAKWPELLDKIAGGGMALGVKIGNGDPAIAVIQGTDAKAVADFKALVTQVVRQELKRAGANPDFAIKTNQYQGIDVTKVGNDFFFAVHEKTIVISNKSEGLKAALDLEKGIKTGSMAEDKRLASATRILPKASLATVWVNLKKVRENPDFDQITKTPRNPVFTLFVGDVADVFTRAPFFCAAFAPTETGLQLTFRMPRGSKGMGPEKDIFCPPEGKTLRPILTPKGTLASVSFYWDISQFWTKRKELFGDMVAKQFEQADKQASQIPFLNLQPSELLQMMGGQHRIVIAQQDKTGYEKHTRQQFPAAAFVTEPRDVDKFYETMNRLIRVGGFAATTQVGLRIKTIEHDGVKIVGYRFREDRDFPGDPTGLRFNVSPCFFKVDKYFVICSTMEFAPKLIDDVRLKVKMEPRKTKATSHHRIFSSGFVNLIQSDEAQVITTTILDQGIPFAEAKKQIKDLYKILRKTGGISFGQVTTDNVWQYNIRFQLTKKPKSK